MSDEKRDEPRTDFMSPKAVAAGAIGSGLAAVAVAAFPPVAVLAAAIAVQAYIAHEVLKDSKD